MSVNRRRPHLFILPEDDANRQLANGFLLEAAAAQMRVLHEAGGWNAVVENFVANHIADLRRYAQRCLVLLLDCDNNPARRDDIVRKIPPTSIGA